jgi:Family of unknown function (DUF6364)
METKLTLRLSKRTIDKAKDYAQLHKISISKMVESYLNSLTRPSKATEIEITPLVKSLSGVIQLEKDHDYKSDYANFLMEKYK